MKQSVGSATNVYQYQTTREIVVNNHFAPDDPLIWARALAACTVESMVFFDDKMRLILSNNRFRTLDGAAPHEMKDLYSLFEFYGKFYSNASHCREIVKKTFLFKSPQNFIMYHNSGWSCDCRSYPVLDGMQLRGVVLLAHTDERGSAFQFGECFRE